VTSSVSRILAGARVHLIAPKFWLAAPWLVLGASLLVSLLAAVVMDNPDLNLYGSGGLVLFYVTFCVVYAQAMAALLPFSMGLSLTRRSFYLGTTLFAAGQSVGYGVVFYLLLLIERGTGGWGLAQQFFAGGWYAPQYSWTVDNPAAQVAIFAVPMFVLAIFGMFVGALYRRFGPRALYALAIGGILGVGGALVGLILWLKDAFLGFFLDHPVVALFAGWPLILAVVFGGAGYLSIRRYVP